MNNDEKAKKRLPRSKEHSRYDTENEHYIHYVPVSYGELLDRKLEEHFVVEYEELEELHLSNFVPCLPANPKGIGFIQVNDYLLDYWSFILSPLEMQVYFTVIRWSYTKGFTIIPVVELAERMGKTPKTIRGALKSLEENFFLLRFQRKIKEDGKGNNNSAPIYIRLNESIPILNKEQIELLPEKIRKAHDNELARINRARYEENDYAITPTNRAFMRNFILEKCKSENRVDRDISFLIKENGIDSVVSSYVSVDSQFNSFAKEELRKAMTKPSYDVFIHNSIFLLEGESLTIICQDKFTEDGLNDSLERFISSLLEKISQKTGINILDYKAYSFSKYYKAMHNRYLF